MNHLSKAQTVLSWFLQLAVAVILLQTLFFKFTGAEESVYIFSAVGRFLNIAGVKAQLDAKQLRPVAVTTLKRSAVLPDLPAMNDSMPGFEVNSWYGMMAPAGTPKEIVNLLQREVAKALKAPDVMEKLKTFGLDPVGNTPEEHAAQLRVDLKRWGDVARAAKIKVD